MFTHFNQSEYAVALKNAYRQFPAKNSTLDLDFINNRSVIAGVGSSAFAKITTARSTIAQYFDSSGVRQSAAINTPRLDCYPVTGIPRGVLIEPLRTNLLMNSASLSTQSVTVTAVAHTLSFYGTGTVTLSGVSDAGPLVGVSNTDLVSLTFTPTAGSLTLTVSGTVIDAQLETGSAATSRIVTTGTALSRSADRLEMTGSNFTDWYVQGGGTFLCEFELQELTESQTLFHAGGPGGAGNDRISIRNDASLATGRVINTTPQASMSAGTLITGNALKTGISVATDNFSFNYKNLIIDTSGTVPTLNALYIGGAAGAAAINGWIKRLTYIPNPISASLLAGITR